MRGKVGEGEGLRIDQGNRRVERVVVECGIDKEETVEWKLRELEGKHIHKVCHNLRVMIVQLLLSVSFFLNLREMENWHDSHVDLVNSVYKTEKRVGNNVLITMSSM